MQTEEQRLIDGLFSRLKQAEEQSAPRDAGAESAIARYVAVQPAAPYYMAQTILIQEAAVKQLNQRIEALESQVSQLQSSRQSSGGFLAGLFGGGGNGAAPSTGGSGPIPGAQNYARQPTRQADFPPQQQGYGPARSGGGFMSGALQTAAGVAGGVVLGNVLMNMFSGSHPQDIVNIIEETPQSAAEQTAGAADSQFLPQDDGSNNPEYQDTGWDNSDAGNDDFGSDDFGGGDDDSWV